MLLRGGFAGREVEIKPVGARGHDFRLQHGGVVVAGRKLGEIPLPAAPSNVTFGGPDRKTLFITARDKVYTLPMKVAGGG